MKGHPREFEPRRIGIIWFPGSMIAEQCLEGVRRQARQRPGVTLLSVDVLLPKSSFTGITNLARWRPHAIVVRLADGALLRQVRRDFPKIPIVSACRVPAARVDSCVMIDRTRLLRMARDHFKKYGVPHLALFVCAEPRDVAKMSAPFLALVPDGHILSLSPSLMARATTRIVRRQIEPYMIKSLRGLPKPIGIVTLDTEMAPYLVEMCHELGLHVPSEVQIIGVDAEDRCLMHHPPITAFTFPNERMGEIALETALCHLDPGQPKPPPAILISTGCRLVVRGSTGPLSVATPAVISKALAYMRTHPYAAVTAAKVAHMAGVGRTSFYRKFSAVTGSTPARQLRLHRLQMACRLLCDTPDTMSAIAKACGFPSRIAFVQFFHRQTGMPPTTFRKKAWGAEHEAKKKRRAGD